jgi:L-fuconolactonase
MRRREFVVLGGGVASASLGGSIWGADGGLVRPTRAIDTHTHFYDPTRAEGVPWPPEGSALYRPVLPEDWVKEALPLGVEETVVVEASPWVEDNQWLLDLADGDGRIMGVVGNLDPTDGAFAERVERFAAQPKFCGIRWRAGLVDLERGGESVVEGARLMASLGLALDLNGSPAVLRHAGLLAGEVEGLKIVINHLGGVGDPAQPGDEWREVMGELAARPGVVMKVSALVEQVPGEVGQAPVETDYYRPVLDALWELFGEDRLIFGSNWPVSERGGSYATLYEIVREYFSGKGEEALEKYFWKNAVGAYGKAEKLKS